MLRATPLNEGWTLEADVLPKRLMQSMPPAGFSLPGAQALVDFAALLGHDDEEDNQSEESRASGAPFSLPAMLPEDVLGKATLSREIDFGALCAQRALLEIDQLLGSGRIELDGEMLHPFGTEHPGAVIDLTDAMRLGRKQTLSICFDDAKDAGVCGTVILKTTGTAWFEDIRLTPAASGRTICAAITLHAEKTGTYAVRAALIPDTEESPWRVSRISISQPGEVKMDLSFSLTAPPFQAGTPYDPPVLKLELRALDGKDARRDHLCDVRTLMTGFKVHAPRAYIPLTSEECRRAPDELIDRAKALSAPALFLPTPASGLLYRSCTLEGIALMPFMPDGSELKEDAANSPCAYPIAAADVQAFHAPSAGEICAQLCGVVSAPPAHTGAAGDDELLFDAAGRRIDPLAPNAAAVIKNLRALQLSLRIEALRQGQYAGSLCAPGEWQDELFFDAMRHAFSPLHLSVLPLRGAWWSQSHFSAALHAFIPEEEQRGAYTAEAELVNSEGRVLAALSKDCPLCSGAVGFLSAILPDEACTLTLRARLRRSGAIIESQEIPVYVGLRGPLEAAFSQT